MRGCEWMRCRFDVDVSGFDVDVNVRRYDLDVNE